MSFTSGFPGFRDRSKSKGIPLFRQCTNDEDRALIQLIRYHLLGDTLTTEQPGRLKHDLNHTCVDGQLDHVNSGSLSVGRFENSLPFQAPQPFNVVECQRIANDFSFPTENPREADPKHLMQLLTESSDQNEKSSDPTLSIGPAQACDTEDLDGNSKWSNFLNGCILAGFPGFRDRSKSKGIPLFRQCTNDEDRAVIQLIRYHLLGDTLTMEQPGRLKHDLNHTCVDGQLDHVNSGSLSVGQFENSLPFQAPQPFNVVECQRIANDFSFPTENPREADPKHLMQLLTESSDQNEKSSDPTLSIGPAQACDTEDLDGISKWSNFLNLQTDWKRKMPLLQESCGQDKKSPNLTPSIEPADLCDAIEVRNATREKTINLPGTSLKDASKSSAGKSAGSVGSKRDWAWKYCYSILGNSNGVICSFCHREFKGGGITRFKSHISGSDLSKNVKKCKNVPPEVEAEIDQKGKKRR